jgi:glutathione peroxidase
MGVSILDIPVHKITGEEATLGEYEGKVILVVNVASKCGLTPQYESLEYIYRFYKLQGLVVVGFPSNDFKEQEPGTESEIQAFCKTYGVSFPLYSKITVIGRGMHPLYRALITAQPRATSVTHPTWRTKLKGYGIETTREPEILWNFEKFLLNRKGEVVARFAPDTQPDSAELVAVIEKQLNNEQ